MSDQKWVKEGFQSTSIDNLRHLLRVTIEVIIIIII